MGKGIRDPRTAAEMRAIKALDADGLRGLRRPGRGWKNLPDTWDLLPVRGHKSWKRYRKTQYRS